MVCPADLRYLKREASSPQGECATSRIVSYLQEIYESIAETLPDFRGQSDVVCGETFQLDPASADAYAMELEASIAAGEAHGTEGLNELLKSKSQRRFKHVLVDMEKVPVQEPRFLPPGAHMRDYWEQMQATSSQKVSFSQFWRVP